MMFIQEEIKQMFLNDLDCIWFAYVVLGIPHPFAKEVIAKWQGVII